MNPTDADKLVIVPSLVSSGPAQVAQEYFFSMALDDADPSAYGSYAAHLVEGSLDRVALRTALHTLVSAHSAFRTKIVEVGDDLQQVILPSESAPMVELEEIELPELPESELGAETSRTVSALIAKGLHLAQGIVLRGRLTKLGPDKHLLVVVFHHGTVDGGSSNSFFRRLFELYADACENRPVTEAPALQYIDVAVALANWANTEKGRAQSAYWKERLKDAPSVEVPADMPRGPVDARRASARRGITADLMNPAQYLTIAPAVREGITRLARVNRVSIYGVYLAGLTWLLSQETGQRDICIETTFDMRTQNPELEGVLGPLTAWTLCRVDLAGCTTFNEAVVRAGRAVAEVKEHGVIHDYYRTVPHELRRVILNYVPQRWRVQPAKEYAGLKITRRPMPFPRWKRPWDLHLTVLDADEARLVWTGNEKLFHSETVIALLAKLNGIFEAGTTRPVS